MPIERLAPDAILSQTNLSGTVAAIQDDPDSPDGNWLTAPGSNNATSVIVSFPSPSGNLTADTPQEFRVWVRKTNHTTNCTAVVNLFESGGLVVQVVGSTTISSTTGQLLSGTFDVSSLADPSGAGVEVAVVGSVGGGGPTNRSSLEVGAIEWNADYTVVALSEITSTSAELTSGLTYVDATTTIMGPLITDAPGIVNLGSEPATFDAVGVKGVHGTGELTAAAATLDAIAAATNNIEAVSAELTAQPATTTGTGVKTIVAVTAILAAAACTTTATTQYTPPGGNIDGSGDLYAAAFTFAAGGEYTAPAGADLTDAPGVVRLYVAPATLDGTGQQGINASGNLISGAAELNATQPGEDPKDIVLAPGTIRIYCQRATMSGDGELVENQPPADITGFGHLASTEATMSGQDSVQIRDAPSAVHLYTRSATMSATGSASSPIEDVGEAGELEAQPAGMQGVGTLNDEAAQISGNGQLLSLRATASATSQRGINGTGNLAAGVVSLSSPGQLGINGSGELYAQEAVVTANGQRGLQGTGDGYAQAATIGVSTGPGLTASGELTARPAVVAGIGNMNPTARDLTGAGSLTALRATTDATTARGIFGSGSLEAQPAALSSPSQLGIGGTGYLFSRRAIVVGDGARGVIATGNLNARPATILASANFQWGSTGTGELTAQAATVVGSGARGIRTSPNITSRRAAVIGTGFYIGEGGILIPYDQTGYVNGVASLYNPATPMAFPPALGFSQVFRISMELHGEDWKVHERVALYAPDGETPICSLSWNTDQAELDSGAGFTAIAAAIISGQPFNLYLNGYRRAMGMINSRPIEHPVYLRLMASGAA